MKVPVLFTNEDSIYNTLEWADPWPHSRNALLYTGQQPVIAHPPCRLFSRLRAFSTAPMEEMQLAYFAMTTVRKNGGILEHPRSSLLWDIYDVGHPNQPDEYGGYLLSVNLSWFGFPAEKKTGLYIVGVPYKDLPALPLCLDAVCYSISASKNNRLKELPRSQRSATPLLLCEWFFEVINILGLSSAPRTQILIK